MLNNLMLIICLLQIIIVSNLSQSKAHSIIISILFFNSKNVLLKMCEEDCKVLFVESCSMDQDEVVSFLCNHGVLKPTIKCHNCGQEISICPRNLQYICPRSQKNATHLYRPSQVRF